MMAGLFDMYLGEPVEGSATGAPRALKQAGLLGLGFVPGAGMADYLGQFPSVDGGTEPSAVQNFRQGNYGTAGMQLLGAAGDALYTVPLLGATVGNVMKAPRAAQKAMKAKKKAPAKTEFEVAHETAQRNAALPVEQGGLGLPPDNTAMDRAKAMGFDTPVYHGTGADIKAFDHSRLGEYTNARTSKLGTFTTDNQNLANIFANQENGNVMPLLMNRSPAGKEPLEIGYRTAKERFSSTKDPFNSMQEAIARKSGKNSFNEVTKQDVESWRDAVSKNYGSLNLLNTAMDSAGGATARSIADPYHNFHIAFQPNQLRSRFAAFDPMQRNSPNLLAGYGAGGIGLGGLLYYGDDEPIY